MGGGVGGQRCPSNTLPPDHKEDAFESTWGIEGAMKLRGVRVTIRPMRQDDLKAMSRWRPFADPLYQAFDFPIRRRKEHDQWFTWRSQDSSRRLYTIENEEGQVIGSLTLREIVDRESARLGITLGADYVSQGYGTEALRRFLDHFFRTMGFERLVLDVAATNLRAVRTYRALGFRQTGHHHRPATHASYHYVHQEPNYRHLRQFFRRRGTAIQVLFYDMAMSREEWEAMSSDEE
jgi:RimJ/RimL family protein N-acetyltransferase